MDDPQQQQQQSQSQSQNPNSPISQVVTSERTSEPVRSRWTPKPEQILILESIFNSGMVNPPKDETVRIRKLLEKFGTVGDANVFYWFQNRRSRSRRRQRQMQAATAAAQLSGSSNHQQHQFHHHTNTNNNNSVVGTALGGGGFSYNNNLCGGSSSSSCGGVGVDVGFFSSPPTHQMNFPSQIVDHNTTSDASSVLYPSDHAAPNFNYHPAGFGGSSNVAGSITVFINGVATEVPRGLVDIKTVFGEDVMLVHSSGVSLPTNEFGFLMQSLQHGESYFLVSKQTQI